MARQHDRSSSGVIPTALVAIGLMHPGALLAAEPEARQVQDDAGAFDGQLQLAQAGDPQAQYRLGKFYMRGDGVQADDRQAVYWLRKSAAQNLPAAQASLAAMYAEGRGVPRDFWQARRWWERASRLGDAGARQSLDLLKSMSQSEVASANGAGTTPMLDSTAIRDYVDAAEQGDPDSQFRLATLYATGEGVAPSGPETLKWLRKAAERGDPDAQYLLGDTYKRGLLGLPKDNELAVRWLKRAAEQESPDAQNLLGVIYATGLNGDQDYALAEEWWTKAAAHDHLSAKNNLAKLAAMRRLSPKAE